MNDTSHHDALIAKQLAWVLDLGPFEIGAFPAPNYDLAGEGSFNGIGNYGEEFQIENKFYVMNIFYVNKNELNKHSLDYATNGVFFLIVVLTDTLDIENYSLKKTLPFQEIPRII